jgi:hypothetical protein
MAGPPDYEDGLFELCIDPLRIRWTIPLNLVRINLKVPKNVQYYKNFWSRFFILYQIQPFF